MESRPGRPERLCGSVSFVVQRGYFFLMLALTGPEWILSAATKVQIHNGVPRSAVLQLYPLTDRLR